MPREEDTTTSNIFQYEVRRWWNYYKPHLLTDFVRVGLLISPIPTIVEYAKARGRDPEDQAALERLLDKFFLPSDIVDMEQRIIQSAEILDTFLSELKHFQHRTGPYDNNKYWIIASMDGCNAAEWHSKYSTATKYFGKVGMRVGGTLMGILATQNATGRLIRGVLMDREQH